MTTRTGGALFAILRVTVGYVVLGRLALLLALPPGYATPIWPAAGFALAATLRHGPRVLPGVFLGSFLVNLGTSMEAGTALGLGYALVPAMLGLGAALQAQFGAFVLKRWVGFPNPLIEDLAILRFLLLGGPVGCLVGASVGVTTLLVAGTLDGPEYLFSWFTWWVGDAIGVLVVTPLMLIFFGEPRVVWRPRRLTVAGPLAVALLVNLTLSLYVSAREQERVRNELERSVEHIRDALRRSFDGHAEVLASMRGLYAASDRVDQAEFRSFVQGALVRHPGIRGLSWNARVFDADRATFEAQLGHPITEKDAGGALQPAAQRPEYLVVTYIEPVDGNSSAIGYDVASDPSRRRTVEAARDGGALVTTARVELVQVPADQSGFLMFMAARSVGGQEGHVAGVLVLDQLVDVALKNVDREGIALLIVDISDPDAPEMIHGSVATDPGGLSWTLPFPIPGRTWELRFTTSARWLAAHPTWGAWAFLAGGLLFTSLLGAFLLVITGRAAKVDRLLKELVESKVSLSGLRDADERRVQDLTLLNELTELLQACDSAEEACEVICRKARQLFPESSGVVALARGPIVERVAEWGLLALVPAGGTFPVESCWALRRGQAHFTAGATSDLPCKHVAAGAATSCLCLPLVGHGETQGVLCLSGVLGEDGRRLASTVAKQVSLALANLKLRETLHAQSIRDPLTGLFNRRYLEACLQTESARASRNNAPLGVIMIDVDHFKRFNDTFGHEAGDAVLRALARLIEAKIRVGDVACRYGGEELTIILPGATAEDARKRAEAIREEVAAVRLHGLGAITISAGVAASPGHGTSGEALLRAADEAMYRAKLDGRDRVVVAG